MRWTAAGVAALVAAGIGLRVLLWDTQSIVSVDGTAFIGMARAMAGGPALDSVQAYGYPVLILAAHLLVPDWVAAARGVALVFGALLLPATWWAAFPFFRERRWAWIPLGALALHPLAVRYSLTTMTETSYAFFLVLMFGLLARGRRFPAGAAAGIAYTIRPEALVAAAAASALPWKGGRAWLRFAAGAAVVAAPYVIAQGVLLGKWTLSEKTINVAAATWRDSEARVGEETVAPGLADRVRTYGGETLRAYPGHAAAVARELVAQTGGAALLLAPLGAAGAALVWVAGVAYAALLPLSFVGARARFFLPLLPAVWVLAALGVERLGRRGRRWAVAAAGVLVVSIGASAWTQRAQYTLQEDGDFSELVTAGQWMAAGVGPETVIYDRKPYVAFYAGARGRYVPTGDYDAVIEHVVAEGGDYLVVNNWVAGHYRPELLPLATDPGFILAETRLVPIYNSLSRRGQRTVIYRVIRPGGPPPVAGEDRVRASIATIGD